MKKLYEVGSKFAFHHYHLDLPNLLKSLCAIAVKVVLVDQLPY